MKQTAPKAPGYLVRPLSGPTSTAIRNAATADWQVLLERIYQRTLDEFLQSEISADMSAVTWFIRKAHERLESDPSLDHTPLALVRRVRFMFEFSISDRRFHSRLIPLKDGEERRLDERSEKRLEDVVERMQAFYLDPTRDSREQPASRRLLARTNRSLEDASPDNDGEEPWELLQLMVPLTRHLYEVCVRNPTGAAQFEVDGFNRALVRNWRRLLEQGAVTIKRRSEVGTREEAPLSSVLNCYPYLQFHEFDSEYMLMVCVNALNESFIDYKVLYEHRIPGITLALIDRGDLDDQEANLRQLTSYCSQLFDRLDTTFVAHRFRIALEASAGEAASISRYWYSKGVVQLLGSDADRGALEDEDVLDFWERFVRDILCARIPGVAKTEIYPFDRVYLMDWTGVSESDVAPSIRVRVLEAAVKSLNPKDKNQSLISLQRIGRELDEFDVTDKVIQYRMNLECQKVSTFASDSDFVLRSLDKRFFIERSDGAQEEFRPQFQADPAKEDDKSVELLFRTLLDAMRTEDVGQKIDREGRQQWVWGLLHNMGLAYEYRHGVNLLEDFPAVHAMQDAYFRLLQKLVEQEGTGALDSEDTCAVDSGQGAGRKRLAKVLYVAYDPMLHPETIERVGKHDENLIPRTQRFTMLLVADDDIEKSASELDAEKKDLQLLLEMIIRQRLRDKQRERHAVRKRLNILKETLQQFMHRLHGDHELPQVKRDQIRAIWEGLKPILEHEKRKLEHLVMEPDGAGLLEQLQGPSDKGRNDMLAFLKERCASICALDPRAQSPQVSYLPSVLPRLALRLPFGVVRESFDVMFKNACEAAAAPEAPEPRYVTVQVQARPDASDLAGSTWLVDVIVENSTLPIDQERLAKLNAETPTVVEVNQRKLHSTGIGVATARAQLKDGVGKGADIRYLRNARNRLQSRMTLPAVLVENEDLEAHLEQSPVVQAMQSTQDHGFLLYVEDTEDIARSNIVFLKNALAPSGIGLQWCRSFKTAKGLLDQKIPRLVITDMAILQSDANDSADAKYGRMLVSALVSLAKQSGARPPIWIVSGHDLEACKKTITGIKDFSSAGYTFVNVTDAADLLQEGHVFLLQNIKFIHECSAAMAGIEKLTWEVGEHDRLALVDTPAVDDAGRFTAASFGKSAFDKKLQAYFGANNGRDVLDEVFVATTSVATREKLSDLLLSWFRHPGMRDLEDPEEPPCALFDTTAHKTVVLSVSLEPELAVQVSPAFAHWCLCRNIVLHDGRLHDSLVAAYWRDHIKDHKGVFSVIRHDLNSFAARFPEFRANADRLKEVVNTSEGHILLDSSLDLADPATVSSQELGRFLEAVLTQKPSENSSVTRHIRDISEHLKLYAKPLPQDVRDRVTRLNQALGALQGFLGSVGGVQ